MKLTKLLSLILACILLSLSVISCSPSVTEAGIAIPSDMQAIAGEAGDYDLIVCSVFEAPEWAVNTAKLCGVAARNMMRGWMKLDTPAVFVVWQSVCFAETYKAVADTVINTHGITKHTPKAIVDKLQGK